MNNELKNCGCSEHSDHKNCADDCGCSNHGENNLDHHHHHNSDEVELIRLTMEDGTVLDCYVLGVIDIKGKEYMVLLSKDNRDLLVYQYTQSEKGLELIAVEDEKVLEMVKKHLLGGEK